jgi:hypothetical protein
VRKDYDTLFGFYRDFADKTPKCTLISDIDALIAKLESEKNAKVIELKRGGVVVLTPTPMSPKHLYQKKHNKSHYTKLSVSVRKEEAADFSDACKKLGLKQADVIMPVIREIITRTRQED